MRFDPLTGTPLPPSAGEAGIQRKLHSLGLGLMLLCPLIFAARATSAAPRQSSAYSTARADVENGRADRAISVLTTLLSANPQDAEAHNLLCRVYSMERQDDAAIRECQAAVAASPATGQYYRFLGRAYGGKASHSSPFAAIGLAKNVRENFQKAVQFDPTSVAALTDLGEFYLEAPKFLGGGTDKAQALVPGLLKLDANAGHWLQARIAETSKDDDAAEAEYKQVIAGATTSTVSNGPATSKAQAWADLASFYRRRKRDDDALHAVRQAAASDPLRDSALVSAAGVLHALDIEPAMNAALLRSYLASNHKTAEEPAFEVEVTLGNLLLKQGDNTGAAKAYHAALALAADYVPAKKALEKLP